MHDAEVLLEQISEWMDTSDFGRVVDGAVNRHGCGGDKGLVEKAQARGR